MMFSPDDLRIIGITGPTLLRMLKEREEMIVSRIYGEYRAGKTEFLALIAELACVKDQISEIKSAILQNEKQKG